MAVTCLMVHPHSSLRLGVSASCPLTRHCWLAPATASDFGSAGESREAPSAATGVGAAPLSILATARASAHAELHGTPFPICEVIVAGKCLKASSLLDCQPPY